MEVAETSARTFREAYAAAEKARADREKAAEKGEVVSDSDNSEQQFGRPPQLTPEEDAKVDELLVAVRDQGGKIRQRLVPSTAKGILNPQRRLVLKENGGAVEF